MKTRQTISKALALCLALLLMVGLLPTAALAIDATDTGTITVSGVEDGVTVSAYRLMDVNINTTSQQPQEPVYSWVTEVAGWVRTNYSDYIGTDPDNSVQAAFSTATADTIAAFYDALAAAIRGGTITDLTPQTRSGSGDISGLTMGNYLILIENGLHVYRPSAVNLVPTWNNSNNAWEMSTPAAVAVKSSDPGITKTVKAPGTQNGQETDNANIGDTLTFDIVADVPQFPANALAKNYVISDSLPAGLTFTEGSIHVYGVSVEGAETELINGGTSYYTQSNTRPTGVTGPTTTTFTLTFAYDQISSYRQIHITYNAVLNGSAGLGQPGNTNTAYLVYSNNPYDANSWQSKEDTATVYTYGLDISKVDADNNQPHLSGAVFELYTTEADAANGNNKIAFVQVSEGVYRRALGGNADTTTSLTVGANGALFGKLTIQDLDEGTWYLKEITAPNGYNLLAGPMSVTITDADGGVLDGQVSGAAGTSGEAVALVALTVENSDGFQLPTTGGIGTVLFTAIGIVLMAAVVLFLVIRKKKNKA